MTHSSPIKAEKAHPTAAPKPGKKPSDLVCLGEIVGAHGVRGALRVRSFTTSPGALAAYGTLLDERGERRFNLQVKAERRGVVIAEIDGVEDRAAAEELAGTRLCIPRAALPEREAEEEYYHADLIGLRVERADGRCIGRVRALYNFGAGGILEIEQAEGGEPLLLPFTRDVVPLVDIAGGRLVAEPPEGAF